jgi:hypothetical protein
MKTSEGLKTAKHPAKAAEKPIIGRYFRWATHGPDPSSVELGAGYAERKLGWLLGGEHGPDLLALPRCDRIHVGQAELALRE